MGARITKRIVDQLAPAAGDRLVWDSEVKGFGVRCRPSGAKYYVLKMRVGRPSGGSRSAGMDHLGRRMVPARRH